MFEIAVKLRTFKKNYVATSITSLHRNGEPLTRPWYSLDLSAPAGYILKEFLPFFSSLVRCSARTYKLPNPLLATLHRHLG